MQPSSSASAFRQQFIPLLPDSYNRTRQHSAPSSTSLNASIWAPQPQSPGGTWPKDVFSFDEHVGQTGGRSGLPQQGLFPVVDDRPLTKEDVFGPVGGTHLQSQKEVGAIGDGRQKDSPFRESEVRIPSFQFFVQKYDAYMHPLVVPPSPSLLIT